MSNVPVVFQILTQEGGLSPTQAAGVIGRFQQESGQDLNPQAYGDKTIPGGSIGIGQWNRDRRQNLLAFAGDNWADPAMQARFYLHETGIKGDPNKPGYGVEGGTAAALRRAQTIEDAAIASMSYERPQGWTADNPTAGHGYRNTVNNAQRVSEQFGGAPGRPMDPVAAAGGVPMNMPAAPQGGPPAGSAVAGGPLTPPMPGAPQKAPKKPMQYLAEGIAGLGGKGGGFSYDVAPQPGAARVDAPVAPMVSPDMQNMQRQQLAMAMARLNQGSLWG